MADRRNRSWSYNKTPCHLYFDHEEADEAAEITSDKEIGIRLSKEPSEVHQATQSVTPTPYLQIMFIACFRASVPFTFAVIMPFVNELLVRDLQVSDEINVGKYSGPVEMASSLGTLLGIFLWARLSEKYGRKPIVLLGVGISAICCSLIGFARRYWLLVLLRHAQGFFLAAAAATVKVMVTDISDSTNLTRHFTLIGTGFQIGAAAAPVCGGLLARPASTWPALFNDTIFDRRPYALPMLVAGFFPATTVLLATRYFQETRPGNRNTRLIKGDAYNEKTYPPTESQESLLEHDKPTASPSAKLLTTKTAFVLSLWFLAMFQINALYASQILFFTSSPTAGGVDLLPSQIALFLGLRPFLVSIWEINVVPPLAAKFGHARLFKLFICIPTLTNILYVVLSTTLLPARPLAILIPALGASLVLHVLANPVFVCLDVLISQRTPSPEGLSDLYALAEITAQLAIGTGAATGSWLFSISASIDGFLKYRLIWFVLISVNVFAAVLARKLSRNVGT